MNTLIKSLKKADVVCSRCSDPLNNSQGGSWRFTGYHWEHKCEDSYPQSGHFIGVSRQQLEKEQERIKKLNKEMIF